MNETTCDYTVIFKVPAAAAYCALREAAGLSPKSVEAAERGLPNTLFAVQVLSQGELVGMGRVVGDGGTFFQVVDIAVAPQHQGRGLGKIVMTEISRYIAREVPKTGYVSLLADGQAHRLYQQFGFRFTAPDSVGMCFIGGR